MQKGFTYTATPCDEAEIKKFKESQKSDVEIMIEKANAGEGNTIDGRDDIPIICQNCCFFEREYVKDNGQNFYHNYGRCKLHIAGNAPACATYLQRTDIYALMDEQERLSRHTLRTKENKLRIMDSYYIGKTK